MLIHRFTEVAEVGKATRRIQVDEQKDPRKEAAKVAYEGPNGTYFFNSASITGCLGSVGSNHKLKGNRKTLRYIVPAAVRMSEDAITILDSETMKPSKSFEVDARPVTIPATKGRIMRYRPRWNKWAARFRIVVNDTLLDPTKVHELLVEAGQQCGIGDFRPEKRGPFGCFQVTSWKETKD